MAFGTAPLPARCETISGALAAAYRGNPDLNQQRAATRASDEGVARAKAGYRPHVQGDASVGYLDQDAQGNRADDPKSGMFHPTDEDLTIRETIFDGNQTTNRVRRSETLVFGSREAVRDTEQTTLQGTATAYMDVLRDTAILGLEANDVALLEYELRGARARAKIGEVTETDVAQAASSLAIVKSQYYAAQGALETSIATYRRFVGAPPRHLEAARPIDELSPKTLIGAVAVALAEHPRIAAALHDVDAAHLLVQDREGALYPTLEVDGRGERVDQKRRSTDHYFQASVSALASVPIYTGGDTYALVRQAKELDTQARLRADLVREEIRALVASTWGRLEAAKSLILSSEAAVKASESALVETREEARLGQRTTYDVLLATQTLLQARVGLVEAQHDRVVLGYVLMAAMGRLSAANLGLLVAPYDPTIHFTQVKDKWSGLRIPDGR